jgi:deoxyribonuclease-4
MPFLGAHISVAGGCHRALEAASALGMEACQLFTKNNKQWQACALEPSAVRLFRQTRKGSSLRRTLAHAAYLINLAAAEAAIYERSVAALADELQRADALGLDFLVVHPGVATDDNEGAGLRRIAAAVDAALKAARPKQVRLLLETTAGQGRSVGHRFEHLAWLLDHVARPERVGVCLDTCHVFAAGYPLAPRPAYRRTMRAFDAVIGLGHLHAFHLNDSKKPRGSRVDRHAHIGQGCLGLESFRLLLNDERFAEHAMILETPKEAEDGTPTADGRNLATLRSLLK